MTLLVSKYRIELIENLIIYDVIPYLMSAEILTSEDAELVGAKESHNQQVEALLNILKNLPSASGWTSLVEALQATEQQHLVVLLTGREPSGSNEKLMSEIKKRALRKFAHLFINESQIDMDDDLIHFLASNVLRINEKERIQAKLAPPQQKELLLSILQRKPDSAFDHFLEGLAICKQFHLVESLQKAVAEEESDREVDCVDNCGNKDTCREENATSDPQHPSSTSLVQPSITGDELRSPQEADLETTVDNKNRNFSQFSGGSLKRKRPAVSTATSNNSPGSPSRGAARLLRQMSFEDENKKIKTEEEPVAAVDCDEDMKEIVLSTLKETVQKHLHSNWISPVDPLLMYIHHISKERISRNYASYITMRVQTKERELTAHCFDKSKYTVLNSAWKNRSPVSVSSYRCNENKLTVKLAKDSKVDLIDSAPFPYSEKAFLYKPVAELKSSSASSNEDCHAKVYVRKVDPEKERVLFGRSKKTQDVLVGDAGDSVVIEAWDDYVGVFQQGNSYFVKNLKLKYDSNSGRKYLTTTAHTEIEECKEQVAPTVFDAEADNAVNSESTNLSYASGYRYTESEIIGIKTNDYYKCPCCLKKLTPQPDSLATVSFCRNKICNKTVKPSKERLLRVTLETPKNMELTVFSSELDQFLKNANPQLLKHHGTSPEVPTELLTSTLLHFGKLKISFKDRKVVKMVPFSDS